MCRRYQFDSPSCPPVFPRSWSFARRGNHSAAAFTTTIVPPMCVSGRAQQEPCPGRGRVCFSSGSAQTQNAISTYGLMIEAITLTF
jgi:hypothetical protein